MIIDMAGKLSFSIAINLLTENFKKGTNSVKSAFRSMQAQILTFAAAMGFAGVSLSSFFSQLIQVARETSKATTALKNVSGSVAGFADNLRFTTDLARKYGVYVNDLTGNFAKFTAAASNANMPMEDQRKLFESLSRASGAFGLSADETNGVFLAVTQMMGKGKIQAEELRGQLGERLPIAMQAMAKAAGTTVAGLDKIMREGKLLSADVLPKLAAALDEMLPNVDTDNIETSLNRLKNAFQEFTQNMGIQDAYKRLIDSITKSVQLGTKNIHALVAQLVAVLTGVTLGRFFKWLVSQLAIAQRSAMVAASKTAKVAGTAFDEIAWKARSGAATMSVAFSRSIRAIRVAFMSMLPTAVFTGIAILIAKIISAREEAKKIKAMFSDYEKETLTIGRPEDADKLQRLYKIASDIKESEIVRRNALGEINGLLGTSYDINKDSLKINGDINTKVAERIKLLKDAAAVEFYQRKKLETEDSQRDILAKYGGTREGLANALKGSRNNVTLRGGGYNYDSFRDVPNDLKRFNQLARIADDTGKQLELFEKNILASASIPVEEPDTKKKKKTDLEKAEEEYAKSVTELTNKLENRVLTETEYDRELKRLNKATYETLSGLLTPEQAKGNKTFQTAKAGVPASKIYETETDYWDEMNKLSGQYAENYLTEKQYTKAKLELTEKTLREIAGMEDIGEAGKAFALALTESADSLRKEVFKVPVYKERDKTFDYKRTDIEKLRADRDSRRDYVDRLKGKIGGDTDELEDRIKAAKGNLDAIKAEYGKNAEDFIDALNEALNNVTSLDEALKIAEVKKDVKDLTKELSEGMYSGVKEVASSADRLVSAFSNLNEVFSDEDASVWERILAVWNAMMNSVDAFMSIVKTIDSLTEITKKLGKAKQEEAVIDTTVTTTKVANAATGAAADLTAATVKKTTAVEEVAANTAAGASEAGKSAAKLPFPLNIVAIGGAIAAAIAAFAAIPKFAGGGIVQGNPTGDMNLARVNGGEMILNGSQQATLFQIANGKGLKTQGGDGEVVFKIKYDELVGVLKNGDRIARRGR